MLRPTLAVTLFVLVASVAPVIAAAAPAGAVVVTAPDDASRVGDAPSILINELANGGAGSDADSFFELRNWGEETVDLTGWQVFRCSAQGLRSNVGRPEGDLSGIVLAPGEIVTVSRIGMPGDLHVTQEYAPTGFGLYLEDPDDRRIDAVGVYPNEPWMTQSECSGARNLPNRLDFAANESWQRVAATGDLERDFIVAPATLGEQNRTDPSPRADTTVVITELASFGPAADDDEFVELLNRGSETVSLDGWQLFRCTASGRVSAGTRELVVPPGTELGPGERFLIAGHGFAGAADARLAGSLANVEFGVLVRTDTGELVDRVAVSAHDDSACQDGDAKIPPTLDGVADESYQRVGSAWLTAPRTPGQANATQAETIATPVDYAVPSVAVSEIATDPASGPTGSAQRNFVELGNYGAVPVDISGWTIRRCQADGTRARELQSSIPEGTILEPGATWLAARAGTEAASVASATYSESLNFLGTGVWVADANGRRVDSVGIYATNEMDASNVTASPCTKGAALTVYLPDRTLGETFRRSQFTGSDADDFVVGPATPGVLDRVTWADPTARVPSIQTAALTVPARAHARPQARPTSAATILEAWGGIADAPLTQLVGPAERPLDPRDPEPLSADDGGMPYVRLVIDGAGLDPSAPVGWSGVTVPGDEIQLSVWTGTGWRLLESAEGAPAESPAPGAVTLSGTLAEGEIRGGRIDLLVQDGPRPTPTVSTERNGELEDPSDYDLALAHITDTQYLSESYPEVYAQLVSWIADNADDRGIEFAMHTGDLVQNWVDPDQNDTRARIEFERASAIQSILDEAGVPNSVLPGNHDSKRGVTEDLFNEYFPPSRYANEPWFGGSIGPDDNSANFSTIDHDGTRFLMLSLPYAYGEEEIAWAEEVVAAHPDHNVVLATHEHVSPATLEVPAMRSTNSRWVSRAQELWDRVIAPNRNVVLVLSGHFHGIGSIVTEDAGGLPGHTVVELLADYQEFRTHTGERATGFFRMLQIDIDGGAIAVDTRSVRLAASWSADYDYRQFVPDNGLDATPSNARPWNIVAAGLQGRYTDADDEFTVRVALQHPTLVDTAVVLAG